MVQLRSPIVCFLLCFVDAIEAVACASVNDAPALGFSGLVLNCVTNATNSWKRVFFDYVAVRHNLNPYMLLTC